MVSSPLNVSVSKELHAFVKSPRFPEIQTQTKGASSGSYNKLSDFDKTVIKGQGKMAHSFGSTHRRFSYMADNRSG
jgi:hypothetical protein